MIDRRTISTILVLTVVGMGILLQLLVNQEYRQAERALERRGFHFTNLLALHTINEFQDDRRDFLLKSFLEHPLFQDMAYFYIHATQGPPVIALTPSDYGARMPVQVHSKALASMVFLQQAYDIDDDIHIYEFSKPVFENGIKTGTIRLGLYKPTIRAISLERISLLAMLAFFIFAGAITTYHGFSKTLVMLSRIKSSILGDQQTRIATKLPVTCDATAIEKELGDTLKQVKQYLDKIENKNTRLTSRIGVVQYEKEQIGRILDSIQLGIIITDIQANVVHLNTYVLNLFGIERSESIDRPLGELLNHPEALEFTSSINPTEGSMHEAGINIHWRDLAPGETYRLSCSFFLDSNQRPTGKMVIVRNVTREKTMEKATRDFTAHLSHELLTPLATIQSYSEMLVDGEIEDMETRNEFYNTIHEETARLSRLIKDILCFSRLENGSLTIEKGLVRSDWLFNDSLAAVTGSALKKNIRIEQILPDNTPSLIGDKEQLKGAIINIIGNAVKYTPEDGKIQFELRENGKMVIFEVNDTGCGISQEELPHIFNKFFRSESSEVSAQPGTGLGLAIANEIVDLHDGKIEVESEIGQGTRFTIKIPKEEYYLEKEH